jgi:hypothetical protein
LSFLKPQTKINDLTAPIGALAFANLFTGRSVGDLLLGLPSALGLTSFTVIDQGQHMYFSFLQDDYKFSPALTFNLGVRYEYATPPIETDRLCSASSMVIRQCQWRRDSIVFLYMVSVSLNDSFLLYTFEDNSSPNNTSIDFDLFAFYVFTDDPAITNRRKLKVFNYVTPCLQVPEMGDR